MTKQKITISLDSEIAKALRLQSIEKYGDSRSMSRLIEDLATGAAEAKKPEACSILGHRSEYVFRAETEFKSVVAEITARLNAIEMYRDSVSQGKPCQYRIQGAELYFALKEACELRINREADMVNACWSCKGLKGPLPKYPDAGKNFEIYEEMDELME
jgi:hypothetical protein